MKTKKMLIMMLVVGLFFNFAFGVTAYELRKAAEKGDAEALQQLQGRAEQGDADAQNELGEIYYWGMGVKIDYRKAFEWFEKAMKQNHVFAKFNIGKMFYWGRGIEKDEKRAEVLCKEVLDEIKELVENGNVDAQYSLGWMYDNGLGVEKDEREAVKWYRLAAEQGNAGAQNNLNILLERVGRNLLLEVEREEFEKEKRRR